MGLKRNRNRLPKGTLWKRGATWWLRYHFRGRHYAESLRTADAAEAKRLFSERMTKVRADAIRGLHPGQQYCAVKGIGRIRLDEAWKVYLQSRSRPRSGEDTLRMYGFQFRSLVTWMKEHHPEVVLLSDMTNGCAWEFLQHLEQDERVSPGTYDKYINTMRRTWRYVLDESGNSPTPWDNCRRKNGAQNRRKDFSADEVKTLLSKAEGWIKTLFTVGIYTGQRLHDCCTLKWEQVIFDTDVIKVVPNKTRDSSGLMVELPMHADLRRHLSELNVAAGSPKNGYVQPDVAERYIRDSSPVSLEIQEFLSNCGFQTHREGTGIDGVRAVVQYGFHSLRHSFVSICLRSEKVNREVIRSIVGDSYLLYNHVDAASKRKAVDLMPSMNPVRKPGKVKPPVSKGLAGMTDGELRRAMEALAKELKRRKTCG